MILNEDGESAHDITKYNDDIIVNKVIYII